jgi:peroxiredoxin
MQKTIAILLLSLSALACSKHSAKIEGRIGGADGRLLRLEKVAVGKTLKVDSVRLSNLGSFSFKVKNVEPATFYQLALDSLGSLMLTVENGNRIHLQAQADSLIASCSLSGSESAELLLQLQQNRARVDGELDSLLALPQRTANEQQEVRRSVARLFIRHKQHNTRFILTHPTSPASIPAYYQKFGKQTPLFGATEDRFLLRALADSMRVHFPKSAYTKSLLVDLDALEANARRDAMQQLLATAEVVSKPEVELADVHGKTHKLSALKGKVVLLDFWASTNTLSLMDNRELLPIYKEYRKSGFEVFQVSLDENAQQWQASVAEQALPWVNLHCNVNEGCTTAQNYVVQKLPANYLINRKGEIVGKNLYGEELKKKIKELL